MEKPRPSLLGSVQLIGFFGLPILEVLCSFLHVEQINFFNSSDSIRHCFRVEKSVLFGKQEICVEVNFRENPHAKPKRAQSSDPVSLPVLGGSVS